VILQIPLFKKGDLKVGKRRWGNAKEVPSRRVELQCGQGNSKLQVRALTYNSIFSVVLAVKQRGFCKNGYVKNTSTRNRYEDRYRFCRNAFNDEKCKM
jgi:hypothetical protein